MRQEREKVTVTESGANNQTGGGSFSPAKKSKSNLLLYILAGVAVVLFTYLLLK